MKKRTTKPGGTESTATKSNGPERAAAHRLTKAALGAGPNRTVGVDLGDRTSHFCVLDEGGIVVERGQGPDDAGGLPEAIRGSDSDADCARGRDAFPLGQPASERARTRGVGRES